MSISTSILTHILKQITYQKTLCCLQPFYKVLGTKIHYEVALLVILVNKNGKWESSMILHWQTIAD